MPLPSSRMTKQPERPARFFPGKALAEDQVSSEEDSDSDDEPVQEKPRIPPPKVTSFPSKPKVSADDTKPKAAAPAEDDLEGFVTASESSEDEAPDAAAASDDEDLDDDSASSEEEEDSSSDDEPKKPMLAPKFIPKSQRAAAASSAPTSSQPAPSQTPDPNSLRAEKTDALLQAQLERDAAARAAGRRAWDDDLDPEAEDAIDDTDGLDAEAERMAWKLRELRRVQREREALVAKEKELEEIERRRNLSAEERAREDAEFLAEQEEAQEGRGKMGFMQKYFHRGAFFQGGEGDEEMDEEVRAALERDVAGRRFEDEAGDKAVLPEYMRIRDMTRLGRKGRTKYKDLREEDTGRWGEVGGKRRGDYDGVDERFRPDEGGGAGRERTGANAAPVGERRRREGEEGQRDGKRARYD